MSFRLHNQDSPVGKTLLSVRMATTSPTAPSLSQVPGYARSRLRCVCQGGRRAQPQPSVCRGSGQARMPAAHREREASTGYRTALIFTISGCFSQRT